MPRDKLGTASGMNTTTARTGGAMGVALAATFFTYGLTAAGLSQLKSSRRNVGACSPEIFMQSFNHTVHIVNSSRLLSVFFSAVRGPRRKVDTDEYPPCPLTSHRARRHSRLILLSVCIGQSIVGLDQRAMTVALPTLTTTFHTAFHDHSVDDIGL